MKTKLLWSLCVVALLAQAARAESVVDESAPLETISTEFQMCDGPAWDGQSSLYVPDVKGGKLYRYWPAQQKLRPALNDAGRISATYFNHGRLYLSDNGESRIAWLNGAEKTPLGGQDPNAQPPAKPNDLVVDNQRGIYYTLTGPGKVIYLRPDGTQTEAVAAIDTPNGVTLSPDERVLYVSSYGPKKIWAYDVTAPGQTANSREFAAMDDGPEKGADGMTIDRAGNVYCAGAKDVWIWSPGGKLLSKITTPTRPINCAFGDGDLHSLYIAGLGGLYRQRMHITGRPPQPPSEAEVQASSAVRLSTAVPKNVEPHWDVPYAQYGERNLLADIFVPTDQPGLRPAVVIVHGGGWINGDKTKFRTLGLDLAARGYVTAVIEYRLGEEARFPAAIHDCNAATRYLRANAEQYHIDPARIGAVGGSAGAHLVGLMAAAPHVRELQGDGGNAEQSSRLQAAVAMAGPMQLTTGPVAERSRQDDGKSFSNVFLGKTVDEAPQLYELASPYTHFTRDTPPILFQTGALDNPERDQPALEKLKNLGVWTEQKIYADGKHGCWNQPGWFGQMADDVDAFFLEHLAPSTAESTSKPHDYGRWEPAIRKFEEADRENPPAQGGIVFVGSSSVVRWDLDEAFPEAHALNRGFGGSQATDVAHFAERVVLPYRPRLVVFFSGGNDLNAGKSVDEVFAAYQEFTHKVHAALPETRILILSVKHSPKRVKVVAQERELNQRLQPWCAADPRLQYLDVATSLLDAAGQPRAEFFVQDGVHLSPAGYAQWNKLLAPHLAKP